MTTYWRIESRSLDPERLLDADEQVSTVWVGVVYRGCQHCDGTGTHLVDCCDDEDCPCCGGIGTRLDDCGECDGRGEHAIGSQQGVSVCRSRESLIGYLAGRSPSLAGVHLVEMEGEECDEEDIDADEGAVLIRPTRIVRISTLTYNEAAEIIRTARMRGGSCR